MDSLAIQLIVSFVWVAVLSAAFYFGSKLLACWVVVGRPAARWRRALDHCPDIVGAARNGK
jgi:hypothetical protein